MTVTRTRQHTPSGWQRTRWLLGAILFVQGFGSALTEALWSTGFGVAGILRGAGLPQWTDLAVGAVGAVLLGWAQAVRGAERRARA
ncbi:hypothetical protein M1P56_13015 [Streptomyces sp. HU2014]|uniref:Uncharacterized protein n=1 Tax=Streptomyces albireticuli TaxID=1940 RepID=A0A1Z2LBT6_9ACTN|nr:MULTISPECIES: hypothetical protein [Streptomyces]ARZ71773.1 hypothetical protein SMD11_6197 [Streptomyces albireticuli]UQI45203.1 hypothetical protein M1P56_13015 [Streptomyces sp. HU2014]